jgi:porin
LLLHAALGGVALLPALAAAADPTTVSGTSATPDPPESIWQRDTLTGSWNGIRTRLEAAGVTLGLQDQEEIWGNMSGGLRRGAAYNGLTTASVSLDLEKLMGWTGTSFFVSANQYHGRGPSANLVGNLQLVSNIEATDDTKLYQLWLEQKLFGGRLTVRIGQEGANDQMMISQYSSLFLNSSFGFPGLPAADLPSGGPNYPMATPFVRAQFRATSKITLVGAVFNGDPAPTGTGDPQLRDKGGVAFRLNDHILAFSEVWFSIGQGDGAAGLPGTYKLGAWYHSGHFSDQLRDTTGQSLASQTSSGIPRSHSTGFAVYGIADQMVWKNPGTASQGVGVFLQVMGSPAEFNTSNLFVEAGLNLTAPFAGRDNDVFGIGVAYLGISPAKRRYGSDVVMFTGVGSPYFGNETVLEVTYLCHLNAWWTLQPDLQYVVHPGAGIPVGSDARPLRDALTGGMRAMITF